VTPAQIILFVKIGVLGAFLAGVFITGHHMGAKGVQADWDASKAQLIDAQSKLIQEHAKQDAKTREDNELRSITAEKNHAQELDTLNQKYVAAVATNNVSGGLRIPRATSCNRASTAADTTTPSGVNEAATVRLPEETEKRLFELAQSADETAIQLTALQKWIVDSGLFPKDKK
jgi:hypothetical protein